MTDTHFEEANRARDQYATEVGELKRLLWVQTLASVLLAVFLAGHVIRVYTANEALRRVNLKPNETGLTLTAFLSTHTVEGNYALRPDATADAVQDLLRASSRLHRTAVDNDADASRSISSIVLANVPMASRSPRHTWERSRFRLVMSQRRLSWAPRC